MTKELQKKVDRGIKLIQQASKMAEKIGQPLEVCYSGGNMRSKKLAKVHQNILVFKKQGGRP